jgi:hypothetical protein
LPHCGFRCVQNAICSGTATFIIDSAFVVIID